MNSNAYIHRSLESVLKRAVAQFPAVALTGPRQSGKTTLLKQLFGARFAYVSLEAPDVREAAAKDPRGFLAMYAPPVIYDEIQHCPGLLPYIKERIDLHRDTPGQFLLTGSQNLLMLETINESLAGRVAVLRLLPLSHREMAGTPARRFPWEAPVRNPSELVSFGDLWTRFVRGFYPELAANPKRDSVLWQSSYIQTYLERDVRMIRQVGDLSQFQSFLRALAARSAQLLSLADLARDLGVAVNTIKSWISVLEATHQIIVLRPYHANLGKRLVKTPKVYFTDTGLLCYLSGLRDANHASAGPMGGPILETAAVNEIVKTFAGRGMTPNVYFWRTSSGVEVDIVVETEGKLVPIEVKLSGTPRPAMAAGIKSFQNDFGEKALPGYLIHPGDVRLPLGEGVSALPFSWL